MIKSYFKLLSFLAILLYVGSGAAYVLPCKPVKIHCLSQNNFQLIGTITVLTYPNKEQTDCEPIGGWSNSFIKLNNPMTMTVACYAKYYLQCGKEGCQSGGYSY